MGQRVGKNSKDGVQDCLLLSSWPCHYPDFLEILLVMWKRARCVRAIRCTKKPALSRRCKCRWCCLEGGLRLCKSQTIMITFDSEHHYVKLQTTPHSPLWQPHTSNKNKFLGKSERNKRISIKIPCILLRSYFYISFPLINPLNTKLYPSDLKIHFVPRSKHSASVLKTDKLMLYKEIIAVCSQIHTKHINTLWAEHRISEC